MTQQHQTALRLKNRPLRACLSLLFVVAMAGESIARPPNIVIILADDLGYGDVGCYGAKHVQTPNIDRLAGQGRRFTNAHSASAVCTPSRYALLTGRYPARQKNLWGPVMLRSPLVVATDRLTVADVVKGAGYATACIGKWHLGFGTETPTNWNEALKPGPLELGFDYYFGVPVVNSHPPFVYVENHHVVGLVQHDPLVYGKRAKCRIFDEKMGIDWIGGAEAAHRFTKQVNSDIENGKIKPDAPDAQLYNLEDDPSQKVNVIRRHPQIAEAMKAELARITN